MSKTYAERKNYMQEYYKNNRDRFRGYARKYREERRARKGIVNPDAKRAKRGWRANFILPRPEKTMVINRSDIMHSAQVEALLDKILHGQIKVY